MSEDTSTPEDADMAKKVETVEPPAPADEVTPENDAKAADASTNTPAIPAQTESVADSAPDKGETIKNWSLADLDKMDFAPAVFIGKGPGYSRNQSYTMPGIWVSELPIDKSGNIMSTMDEYGYYKNPGDSPDFARWVTVNFSPGELVWIPAYDKKLYNRAAASEQFAMPEWLDQINKWFDEGVTSLQIFNRIQKAKGLIPFPPDAPKLSSNSSGG